MNQIPASCQLAQRLLANLRSYTERNFTEGSKILLDTDLKIILLDYQNNFVGILKIMNNAARNFDILATNLNVLYNYFDSSTKLLFCIQLKF